MSRRRPDRTRREPIWPILIAGGFLVAVLAVLAATTRVAPAQEAGKPCAETAAIPGAVTVALDDGPGADTVTVAPDDAYLARICYHNHVVRRSGDGPFGVTFRGLRVRGEVAFTSGGAERVTIRAPEGTLVLPRNVQDVQDGDGATFFIAEIKV